MMNGPQPTAPAPAPSSSERRRDRWRHATAAGMLVFGCCLATAGMFMPPPGEVSASVMGIFAQCVIYAASVFGLQIYIDERLRNKPK